MNLRLVPPPEPEPEKPESAVVVTYRYGNFYFTDAAVAQTVIREWEKKFPLPPIYLGDR